MQSSFKVEIYCPLWFSVEILVFIFQGYCIFWSASPVKFVCVFLLLKRGWQMSLLYLMTQCNRCNSWLFVIGVLSVYIELIFLLAGLEFGQFFHYRLNFGEWTFGVCSIANGTLNMMRKEKLKYLTPKQKLAVGGEQGRQDSVLPPVLLDLKASCFRVV